MAISNLMANILSGISGGGASPYTKTSTQLFPVSEDSLKAIQAEAEAQRPKPFSGAPSELREELKKYEPVIQKALKQYAGGASTPVVRDRARILAAQALKSFDPQRGARIETHLMRQLQQLQRDVPRMTDPLPIPEQFRRDQYRISEVRRELEDETGLEPDDVEIADRLRMPVKRVRKVLERMSARVPWSVYEEGGEDDEGQDVVTSERSGWDEWVDAVYQDLPARDRRIMAYRTGYGGVPTLSTNEIAEKLGITPQVVSQRSRMIQKQLDRFHT